jgi:hypothetical protein
MAGISIGRRKKALSFDRYFNFVNPTPIYPK